MGSPGSNIPFALIKVSLKKLTILSTVDVGGTPPTYNLLACKSLEVVLNEIAPNEVLMVLVLFSEPGNVIENPVEDYLVIGFIAPTYIPV